MRNPWPRIHTDSHGCSFFHCETRGGGTGGADQSSEVSLLRHRSPADSAKVGLLVQSRGFGQLSVRGEPRPQQSDRHNTAEPFYLETILAPKPHAQYSGPIPPIPQTS